MDDAHIAGLMIAAALVLGGIALIVAAGIAALGTWYRVHRGADSPHSGRRYALTRAISGGVAIVLGLVLAYALVA